jgi:hypothetical protein
VSPGKASGVGHLAVDVPGVASSRRRAYDMALCVLVAFEEHHIRHNGGVMHPGSLAIKNQILYGRHIRIKLRPADYTKEGGLGRALSVSCTRVINNFHIRRFGVCVS